MKKTKKILAICLVAIGLTGVVSIPSSACEYYVSRGVIINCGDGACNTLTWVY